MASKAHSKQPYNNFSSKNYSSNIASYFIITTTNTVITQSDDANVYR